MTQIGIRSDLNTKVPNVLQPFPNYRVSRTHRTFPEQHLREYPDPFIFSLRDLCKKDTQGTKHYCAIKKLLLLYHLHHRSRQVAQNARLHPLPTHIHRSQGCGKGGPLWASLSCPPSTLLHTPSMTGLHHVLSSHQHFIKHQSSSTSFILKLTVRELELAPASCQSGNEPYNPDLDNCNHVILRSLYQVQKPF